MLDKEYYTPVKISKWEEILNYEKKLTQCRNSKKQEWIFRGRRRQKINDQIFDFIPSLERAAMRFNVDNNNIPNVEKNLLREFKRKLHNYTTIKPPKIDDSFEWLALMQHYGAPTRLLDWTYSFFVATYFAIEFLEVGDLMSLSESENNSVPPCDVWAINTEWLSYETKNYLEKDVEQYKKKSVSDKRGDHIYLDYLFENPKKLIYHANPFTFNDRLNFQQGTFLIPGDISESFEDNLIVELYSSQIKDNIVRFEIYADIHLRKEIVLNLYRMNINRATLFPSLVGFSESLWTRLATPEIFGWDRDLS